jgi:hypothetical protein
MNPNPAGPPPGYVQQPPPRRGPPTWVWVVTALVALPMATCGSCVICAAVGQHEARQPSGTGATTTSAPKAAALPNTPPEEPAQVDMAALLSEYKDNEVRADSEFKGKLIVVKGKVDSIKKGLAGGMFVTAGTGKQFEVPVVQCDLNAANASAAMNLSKGQVVTLEGRVNGLMFNVHLDDCDIR